MNITADFPSEKRARTGSPDEAQVQAASLHVPNHSLHLACSGPPLGTSDSFYC